ncbi:MAG: hypothetical protein H6981_02935 [Gammaproteobacteria bacterium]|nr:hypothetical protein [Gammaproteobacteria bacterium]MCP5135744.1 hypothetical protein [Gammaproteobacteria bacterium]
MANDTRAKRHVYLPGLSAFDTNHRSAALHEMGFSGNNEFRPGSVFVDTVEAQTMVRTRYQLRHTEVMDTLLKGGLSNRKKLSLQREYRALSSAIHNVHVVNPDAGGFNNQDNRNPDVLFVKGHGSPNNPNAISTRATPVDMRYTFDPQTDQHTPFEHQTTVRMQRGFKVRHTATEIGTNIHNIFKSIDSPGLDVRMTSCGSGGTVSRDDVDTRQRDLTQTFAGQVSGQLDTLQTDQRVRVSGYQGDSNSSLPSRHGGGPDGFTTKLKQRTENLQRHDRFQNAVERQTAKLGPLTQQLESIKQPLRDMEVGNAMRQLAPAPQPESMGVSDTLRQRMRAFTKITTTDAVNVRQVAIGPRMNARTPIPRN